jgi:hypothetical protein
MAAGFIVNFVGLEADAAALSVTSNTLRTAITPSVTESVKGELEIQTITFDLAPDGGAFKITWNAIESGALNYNDNAATVQAAIRAIDAAINAVTVTGTVAGGLAVQFDNCSGDISAITVTSNTLTKSVTPAVTETVKGVAQVVAQCRFDFDAVADAGTWKIKYGAESTSALAFDASAATIQTAVRLLTGLGSVTVAGTTATNVIVTMTGTSGPQALTYDDNILGASGEEITITNSTPVVGVAAVIEQQLLQSSVAPTTGTTKLSYGGTASTSTVAYNGTAADVQTALREIAALASVTVAGDSWLAGFTVTMTGVSGDATAISFDTNGLAQQPAATVTETNKGVVEQQVIQSTTAPNTGAYKLTYGGNESAELAYDADAAAVQTALRALAGLASVTVAGTALLSGYTVTMTGVPGDASAITVTSNTLGQTVTASDAETIKGVVSVNEVQTITWSAVPTSGTFKLTWGGNSSSAIAFDASASAIQTAFRAVSGVDANCTVSGTFAGTHIITFLGTLADTDVTAITVTNSTLSRSTVISQANDTIAITSHGFVNGQRVYCSAATTMPGGTSAGIYYVIWVDANTIKLAASHADAVAGTAIDLTDAGSGTLSVYPADYEIKMTQYDSTDLAQLPIWNPCMMTVTSGASDSCTIEGVYVDC